MAKIQSTEDLQWIKSLPTYTWGKSLELTGKGHPIAKRVWDTKDNMLAYLSDETDSAVPGIILVVTKDTPENNGAYLVQQIKDSEHYEPVVVKMLTNEAVHLTQQSIDAGVKYIDGKLDIPDMRTYWESIF